MSGKESSAPKTFCARKTGGQAADHHAREDAEADGHADGNCENQQQNKRSKGSEKNRIHDESPCERARAWRRPDLR